MQDIFVAAEEAVEALRSAKVWKSLALHRAFVAPKCEAAIGKLIRAIDGASGDNGGRMSDAMRDYLEGMSVSVDVSTSDETEGHRYFGTVTEVMDDASDKHGVTLLVQDAEPNFSNAQDARPWQEFMKNACRVHLDFTINRYLLANADGRWDGAEKAQRHIEICSFYVSMFLGGGLKSSEHAMTAFPDEFEQLHEATQAITDFLDESIGFPLRGVPDYDALVPVFFEKIHEIALNTLGSAALKKKETQ